MDIWEIGIGIFFFVIYITAVVFFNKNKSSFLFNTYESDIDESNIALIILAFLNLKGFEQQKQQIILDEAFETYSEKMHGLHSYLRIDKLIEKYSNVEININPSCVAVSKYPTKQKLFLVYSLLDIASSDKIYSYEEENFIENVRTKIKIPKQTFQAVKNVYIKKGMKDERMIHAENERKKRAKSYLPYNAYKILGVTSAVSKAELKKVYRTLAKKFHPDLFHGKGKEIVQKAEEKFEKITKAYEIIKKHKEF